MELRQRANQLKQLLDHALANDDLNGLEIVTWENLQP